MFCPQCGVPAAQPDDRFCEQCGASLQEPPADASPRCAAHPDAPAVEICERCGGFACAQCVRVAPGGRKLCARCWAPEEARWSVPWEERAKLGRWKAFFRTARQTMFSPAQSYAGLPPDGRWWDPISFVLYAHLFLMVSVAVILLLIFGAVALGERDGPKFLAISGSITVAAVAVLVPLGAVVRIFLGTGIEHLLLLLFGGAPAGFQATFRAHCYSFGPAVIAAIPGCGPYVSETWQVVLRIFGYRGVHRIGGGRSAAAVLLPIAVCCGGYALFVFAVSLAEGAGP